MKKYLFLSTLSLVLVWSCRQEKQGNMLFYNILNFGAIADTTVDSREAIQKAIDAAYKNGGGTVVVPPGKYLTGGIEMKDNVTLKLNAGAVLFGSKNLNAYTAHNGFNQHGKAITRRYLISIKSAKNVTLCGKGTIDGQGLHYWETQPELPHWIKAKPQRPNALVEVGESENITITEVTLTNSPNWTCHILHSKDIVVHNIRIINSLFAPNADGIDITGSRDVRVSNCDIKTCDDGIVLKTWKNGKSCEDVTVTNCTIETLCAALKLGTESYQDYRRIAFSNCAIKAASRLFAIYVRDGCTVEDVAVSNIVGTTKAPLVLNRPVQIMITRRNQNSKLGRIRNVQIHQMICKTDGRLLLTADKGASIDNLSITKLHLDYPFIEDPAIVGKTVKSGQFPRTLPEMIQKRAAIVAKNLNDFQLKDLTIHWTGEKVPNQWQIPVRIINGDFNLNFKHDYRSPRQTEFNVLYGDGLHGGTLDNPLTTPSNTKLKKYDLKNSTIKIKQ